MKFNIKCISFVAAIITPVLFGGVCYGLSEKYLGPFSQNNIMFYNPEECEEQSENTCGNSAKEIYWSALSKTFSKEVAAGIMGNIINEGDFNPVSVESCTQLNPFDFHAGTWKDGWSWEAYFNDNSKVTGVGAFGTTSARSEYLHYVQEKAPNLIEYFQHPEKYSLGGCNGAPSAANSETGGDALMSLIGQADYNQLVTLEVEFLLQYLEGLTKQYGKDFFDIDYFKSITDPADAAEYFSMHAERCQGCLTAGSSENQERRSAAKKVYDQFSNFTCSGGIYKGKQYNYDDTELRRIAAAAKTENSCTIHALKTEMSQMANLAESRNYASVGDAINCGWYAPAAPAAYASGSGVTDEELEAARDVINNGNRTIPAEVVEHDCINCSAGVGLYSNDGGNTFNPITESSKSEFKQGSTILKQNSGGLSGRWVFWTFADNNGGEGGSACGDPFGYYENNPPKNTTPTSSGSTSSSSSSSSNSSSTSSTSGSKAKVNISDMTLIGDSIAVAAESALKEKFPNSFMSMVGSRHATLSSRCNDDTGGGLAVLKTIASGSGTVATEGSSGCSSLNVDSSSMKDAVVWEIGTNGVGATDSLNEVINVVGDNRKLYLVTPYTTDASSSAGVAAIAEAYRNAAKEHDNVFVIEWANAVKGKESQYLTDGTHPTAEGATLLADLISQASASSSICTTDTSNFTWWSQCDKALNAQDSSLCQCGCGPVSFAMLATALLGHEISPVDVAQKGREQGVYSCGSSSNFAAKVAPLYGLEYQHIEASSKAEAAQKVSELLRDGWMIHTSGNSRNTSNPLLSISGAGHVIGIRGITSDGKWLVANSGGYNGQEQTLELSYDPQEYFVNDTWQIDIRLDAIRASSTATGNSTNCGDQCSTDSNDSGGLSAGGLDKTAADKLMEEYRNSSASELIAKGWIPSVKCNGGSLSNCVSFVQYFIHKYTTKGDEVGGLPNGSDVVGALLSHGFKDGGTTPRPYAVFSTESGVTYCGAKLCGHTGVVLNIDTTRNTILIGEAGCSADASWTGAHEYPLDKFTNGGYTYAYTDDFLQGVN